MKKALLNICLFLFLFQIVVYAQPSIRQQRTIGSSADDISTCMALTKDGGYILGGYNAGFGDFDQTKRGHGGSDYWIVKLDSLRNIAWDKTIGGSSYDWLTSIQSTNDGGYILAGSSSSTISGNKTEDSIGGSDIWIVKLNSKGGIQWDKTIGGTLTEDNPKILQTIDGGYIMNCSSSSNISGQKTENSRGGEDYWVVKLDALGNVLWDKTIGGSELEISPNIALATDGGYLVGGTSDSDSSGEKTQNARGIDGRLDYWVIKLNSIGNIQWDKTIGGDRDDILNSINGTFDKGFILGGSSASLKTYEKTQKTIGHDDYWFVKLDSVGNIKWDRTIGGKGSESLHSVRQTLEGGFIAIGSSDSYVYANKSEPNRGGYDYWVVKLNVAGMFVWDKTIGGSDVEYATDIFQIEPHRFVMVGESNSGVSGDKNKPSKGLFDYWYVELKDFQTRDSLTNVQVTSNTSSDLKTKIKFQVYPNPAKDVLYIQASSITSISLINQRGQVLLTTEIYGKAVIDISKYPAGVYYLKDNKTSSVEKVVITR